MNEAELALIVGDGPGISAGAAPVQWFCLELTRAFARMAFCKMSRA